MIAMNLEKLVMDALFVRERSHHRWVELDEQLE